MVLTPRLKHQVTRCAGRRLGPQTRNPGLALEPITEQRAGKFQGHMRATAGLTQVCRELVSNADTQGKMQLWLRAPGNLPAFRDTGWQAVAMPKAFRAERGSAGQEDTERGGE